MSDLIHTTSIDPRRRGYGLIALFGYERTIIVHIHNQCKNVSAIYALSFQKKAVTLPQVYNFLHKGHNLVETKGVSHGKIQESRPLENWSPRTSDLLRQGRAIRAVQLSRRKPSD